MGGQIKNKLLIFWISSVLLTLFISGEIYKYMVDDFFINNSKEKINTLHLQILKQKEMILKETILKTDKVATDSNVISSIAQISKYQNPLNYNAQIFNTEKLKLLNLIKRFFDTKDDKSVFVFDSSSRLLVFKLSFSPKAIFGIVSYNQKGEPQYLKEDFSSLTLKEHKYLTKYLNEHSFTQQKTILYHDSSLIIEHTSYIKSLDTPVGYVHFENLFNVEDTFKLNDKKDISIDIIYKNSCRTLSQSKCHKLINNKQKDWFEIDEAFLGYKPLTSNISFIYSINQKMLEAGKNFIRTSQKIVFLAILPLLSLGILLFVRYNIATPIVKLLDATKKIKKGLLYKEDETLSGEFQSLSATFANLSQTIIDREEELKDKNIKLEESLLELEEYHKALNASSIISKGNLDGTITYVNDTLCNVTGYKSQELLGQPHNIFKHPDTHPDLFKTMWKTILNKQIWKGVVKNLKKDGSSFYVNLIVIPILDKENNIKEFIALRQDISELINSQDQLRKLSLTDSLTKLGNRYKLLSDLRKIESPVLALVNIDRFKEINDFYGIAIGDKTIIELANRLLQEFHQNVLYRVHSDEFAILFDTSKSNIKNYSDYMLKICKHIETFSFNFGDVAITLNLTCGISNKKDSILKSADLALKTAKKEQKDILVYNENIKTEEEYKNNIEWNAKIKSAIIQDRIVPFFQTIHNNKTKHNNKFESLIRLIDEDNKVISPDFFLDIAKKTKQYSNLTKIMLEKTFEKLKDSSFSFSINLTADDIKDKETFSLILKYLSDYNLGDRVIFEIVESEGFENFDSVQTFIQSVKSYGAKVAIDDFGTGYSNFAYLIKLKVDFIKIDGSLIKNIDTDKDSHAVIETIVSFAKKNNLQTVAEFVSSESIYEKVCELGIDFSQGYYIDKPQKNLHI